MEQLNLPFTLGMDYEELEFDLEILPDRIEGYDSYRYLGKFNNFLNYSTYRIDLLFRMDVMEGIVFSFYYLSPEDLGNIMSQLESLLNCTQIVFEQNYRLYKFEIGTISVWLLSLANRIYLFLSNTNFIHSLYTSLLW